MVGLLLDISLRCWAYTHCVLYLFIAGWWGVRIPEDLKDVTWSLSAVVGDHEAVFDQEKHSLQGSHSSTPSSRSHPEIPGSGWLLHHPRPSIPGWTFHLSGNREVHRFCHNKGLGSNLPPNPTHQGGMVADRSRFPREVELPPLLGRGGWQTH